MRFFGTAKIDRPGLDDLTPTAQQMGEGETRWGKLEVKAGLETAGGGKAGSGK